MAEINVVTSSTDAKSVRVIRLSSSKANFSHSLKVFHFPDNLSRDSSLSPVSSTSQSIIYPCSPHICGDEKVSDWNTLKSTPNQERKEVSLPAKTTEKTGGKCRRSKRVTNCLMGPLCDVDITDDSASTSCEKIETRFLSPGSRLHAQKFLDTFLFIAKCKPMCFSALMTLEFDVFRLIKLPKPFSDMPLLTTTVAVLHELNIIRRLKISWLPVVKFLINVENSYNDHPYHSSWHAADVVGTMAYFFCHGYFKRSLSPVHQIIGLLAAASHDVDHDAKTNKFHTLAKTPIGISCAESNMEHYHIARAKQILKLPGCD